jgi:hypothetical protein
MSTFVQFVEFCMFIKYFIKMVYHYSTIFMQYSWNIN